MLQLQADTESEYNAKMETFRDVRHELSALLIGLNTAGVTELTEAIREVTALGLEAMEWIDEASGDEFCISSIVSHWEEQKFNTGISLSSCADQFSAPVVNATESLLNFITEQSQIVFEGQNLVLGAFSVVSDIQIEKTSFKFISNSR